jgi:hypothetical protein
MQRGQQSLQVASSSLVIWLSDDATQVTILVSGVGEVTPLKIRNTNFLFRVPIRGILFEAALF